MRVTNRGSVPGADTLHHRVPQLFVKRETTVKNFLQDLTVSVIMDDTPGDRSKSMVNILFTRQSDNASNFLKLIIVEVAYTEEVNTASVGASL